jgi:hypothetical protein
MSKTDLREAVIRSIMDAALPFPVIWPNSSEKPPKNATWARGAITRLDGAGGSLGPGGKDKFNGSLEFKIFTKQKTTEAGAYSAFDNIGDVVKRGAGFTSSSGEAMVRITATGTRPGGDVDGWHLNTFRADFFAYVNRG